MNSFFKKVSAIVTTPSIRNRILFVIGIFLAYRLLATIPVPGVDTARLAQFLDGNQLLGLFNALSGGGLSSFSIVMLGVSPYITASIIMQVGSMIFPRLKELMTEEGEMGRRIFSKYTRLLALPVTVLQAFGFLKYLQSQGAIGVLTPGALMVNILIITAGSILLLWMADLISEFGIGNGTSMIIMAGIVAQIPTTISQFLFTFTIDQLPMLLVYLAIGFIVIAGVVYIYEAERPVPVTYARQVRGIRSVGGADSYIPLRLTQAGVMPIIFASSMLLFPQFIATFLANSSKAWAVAASQGITTFLQSTIWYSVVYFVLVVFFTYFYTAVTFDPKAMADNLQKNGAFIPGTRPGQSTNDHIAAIVTRITFVGSIFLGVIAVLPLVVRSSTGITAFAIGGTSILITVSVVIDLIRRIDAQVAMQEY